MWEPPPESYETSRDFISFLMERACSTYDRNLKSWDEAAAKHNRSHVTTRGYVKERLINDFFKAWTHAVNRNDVLIKKLKDENERLSAKVIKDHEEVITLHREIKSIREQEIKGLKTVVETAVDTYSKAAIFAASATASSAQTLDSRVMWKGFQEATEADEKAKNVVVFGLSETAEEDVKGRVCEILDAVGE